MNEEKLLEKALQEMVFPPKTYEKPFLITLCGYSGSGKTTFAKVLSQELKAYIVGGEHIRQQLYREPFCYDDEKNNRVTSEICKKEVEYLLDHHISVILDKSVSSKETKEQLQKEFPNLISIHLISSDEENIKRLKQKQIQKTNLELEAWGDVKDESGVYLDPEKIYEIIKKRKVYDLEEFDYKVNTLQPLEKVIEDVRKIAEEIRKNQQ